MTYRCPSCRKRKLEMPDEDDFEMVCQSCGTAYRLEEIGYYESGGNKLLQRRLTENKEKSK